MVDGAYTIVHEEETNTQVPIHHMVAIADGADPERVFDGQEHNVHHRNGYESDNRPDNLAVVPKVDHAQIHNHEIWTAESGWPRMVEPQDLGDNNDRQ